jgi:mycothiol synthase
MSYSEDLPQLRMIWPKNLFGQDIEYDIPSDYILRRYQKGDEKRFFEIMSLSGWEGWNQDTLNPWLAKIIPDSWLMVIEKSSKQIVCTAMALHNYKGTYPFWGELGWLASDPEHSGKGLGLVVSAAVTERLMDAGYRNIQLFTEDFRLPAIKTYFKLGYVPSIYKKGMFERWKEICASLDWPFKPSSWDKAKDA